MNPIDFTPTSAWMAFLEGLLCCPRCAKTSIALEPMPRCAGCGWSGAELAGIPSFIEDAALEARDRAELEAQRNAVEKYYENEEKLSCQWDRLSAEDLPVTFGSVGGLVLDLGCGTGSAGTAFCRAGAKVIGVDLSMTCLRVASRRLDGVVRASSTALPFPDGTFDALIARGALHHFNDPEAALGEARRVLRRGGRLLVADPREFAWLEPIKHVLRKHDDSFTHEHHAYGVKTYVEMVARHFDIDEVRTLYPFGIMMAVGLDLLPLPRFLPKRLFAQALLKLDHTLNRSPLSAAGHLILVTARKP